MRFSLKALAKDENDDTTAAADTTRATGKAIAPAAATAPARAQTAIAAIAGGRSNLSATAATTGTGTVIC